MHTQLLLPAAQSLCCSCVNNPPKLFFDYFCPANQLDFIKGSLHQPLFFWGPTFLLTFYIPEVHRGGIVYYSSWISVSSSWVTREFVKCFLSILHKRPFDASPRKGWDKSLKNFTFSNNFAPTSFTKPQEHIFSKLIGIINAGANVNQIPSYFLVVCLFCSGLAKLPQWNTNASLYEKYF